MKEVFVDTGYFVATLHQRDQLHSRALEEGRRAVRSRLVTTDFVLIELLTFFAEYGREPRAAAARTVDAWRANPSVLVIAASRVGFLKALARYRERADKGYSLTDCHSMLVMEERGITETLSPDEHFEQAGFRALLRDRA